MPPQVVLGVPVPEHVPKHAETDENTPKTAEKRRKAPQNHQIFLRKKVNNHESTTPEIQHR